MVLHNNRLPACRVGNVMIRISISFFYELGAAVRQISNIQAGSKLILNDVWIPLINAQTALNNLLTTPWLLPAIKSAYAPGQKLLNVISPLTARTDFNTELTPMECWNIGNARSEFETVLKNEFAICDAYYVSRKAGYDTTTLLMNAELIFSPELATKVSKAIFDVREAGKCIAYEASTAAGFHILRATESVLRIYWDATSGGKPHPKPRNLGVYLKKMEKQNIGNNKVRATLMQIKDLHRNPLMHPEETLTLDEALSLFGICQSAISAMLKEIPTPPVLIPANP